MASTAATSPISAYASVGVVGAGSWGTALAVAAAEAGRSTLLYARDRALADAIEVDRVNERYLPGISVPDRLRSTSDLTDLSGSDTILVVVPAQHLRETMRTLAPILATGTPVVICAKGIESASGKLLHEVVAEEAPHVVACVLSGPSFARDVALGLPTAIALAGPIDVARRLQAALARPVFRPYASDDVVGVALGGAAKNVYAIACGLAAGYGLGESARAALLARSFSELLRMGVAIGARSESLMGLAGLGDLVLSATSRTSRNFDYGYRLATGARDGDRRPLAEGAATSGAILLRADVAGVALPVARAVHDVVTDPASGVQAIEALLARPVRDE